MESGFESLLPSHSDFSFFPWNSQFLPFNHITIASALVNRICHVFVTWNEIYLLAVRLTTNQKAGGSNPSGHTTPVKAFVSPSTTYNRFFYGELIQIMSF
jgi:hypothetical protein